MKKIFIRLFLLLLSLCLVGCVHSTYSYQFHFYVDGGNGTLNIETSSSFNPDVKLCKDAEDMCTLDCLEESYFVALKGAEEGSREITFIATPNTGYQVKEWLFNGKSVIDNQTNTFTAVVSSECDYNGVIAVGFEEIQCDHLWDEGVVDATSSLLNPPIKYTCLLCESTKKEPCELVEHNHKFLDNVCKCGTNVYDYIKDTFINEFGIEKNREEIELLYYFGEYNGCQVAMIKGDYNIIMERVVEIEDIIFYYKLERISVCINDRYYLLEEAYDINLITYEDVLEIYTIYQAYIKE